MSALHHLVVRSTLPDDFAGPPSTEDLAWTVACLRPDDCHGWTECPQDHPCTCHDPDELADLDEHVFHGQRHVRQGVRGWALPMDACPVVDVADRCGCETAEVIARENGVGTFEVDADCLDLFLVGEVA